MSLSSGSSLGSYEIIGTLGAGGMGEVYRARDTRLGREVAVKVVLEAFVLDRERLVRFEREAKSLAALNHPNIATLFGMEESGGRHFLVMELVEGETLAEKIGRAPLPLEAAISIARQMADALETAHEKGIIHRDLKPANVKITPDDKVKVLDFGLARAMDPNASAEASPSGLSLANSPTMSAMATQAGVILGTASYMSPEQARGMVADHRSDIFSFGVVLYEMLTGRQPFQGDTVSDVLASVLARDPDLASLPPDLAPRLSELLRRCLEKHPKKRWQAIGDVRHELEIITSNPRHVPSVQTTVTVAEPPKPWWRRAMPLAAAALGASIITGGAMWMTRPTAPAGVVSRFVVPFGEGQQNSNVASPVAISPDGARIAYVALPSRQIVVRAIGDLDVRPITEVRIAYTPRSLVFSPDGNSIAYLDPADTTIKRIDVAGGAPVTVCKSGGFQGMGWSGETIVFAIDGGIMQVPASGGEPQQLVPLGKDETAAHPQLLDDGRVLFALASAADGVPGTTPWPKARIVLQKPGDSTRTTLVEGGVHARYLPTGHLVYWSGGVLFGRTFNPATSALGGAVSLVEGVQGGANKSSGWYDVSATGSLIYIPGAVGGVDQPTYTLALTDRAGKAEPLGVPAGPYSEPRMSPDGRRVAFGFSDARDTSIWVYDIGTGGSARRLTFGGRDRFPVWSSDSERVIFQSDREGDLGLFWQRADGVGAAERLTKPDKGVAHVAQSASRDGRWLLMDQTADSKTSLMAFSFKDKSAAPFGGVVTTTPTGAIFSPDDRWVAYSERGTSSNVVYVQPFPATGAKVQISPNTEDGHHQVWSSDGKELYYTPGAGNRLTAVTVMASQGFAFGPAPPVTRLFWNNSPAFERTYDVARDGKRFLGLLSPEALSAGASTRPEIRVVLNWFEELKARAPVK